MTLVRLICWLAALFLPYDAYSCWVEKYHLSAILFVSAEIVLVRYLFWDIREQERKHYE